jgi:hypothetical protein
VQGEGGYAEVLASAWAFALFQSVQIFEADGRKPMPRQWLDGVVDVVVAGDAGTPLAIASGAATTDPGRAKGRGHTAVGQQVEQSPTKNGGENSVLWVRPCCAKPFTVSYLPNDLTGPSLGLG